MPTINFEKDLKKIEDQLHREKKLAYEREIKAIHKHGQFKTQNWGDKFVSKPKARNYDDYSDLRKTIS